MEAFGPASVVSKELNSQFYIWGSDQSQMIAESSYKISKGKASNPSVLGFAESMTLAKALSSVRRDFTGCGHLWPLGKLFTPSNWNPFLKISSIFIQLKLKHYI